MRPLVLLVAVLCASCGGSLPRGPRPALLPPRVCPDGAPVKWLQHPACGRVCGYSCLPDRWRSDAAKD